MADHGAAHHRGEMDISHHVSTFNLFIGMTKWGSLGVTALVAFLALMFCTQAGFMGAAAVAVVLTIVGVVLLRERADAH
jgi:hypothetical protein